MNFMNAVAVPATAGLCDSREAWDAYVQAAPHATPYHLWMWRDVLGRTYGHTPHYLAAWREREIAGVLPLVEIKSFVFGHSLVSLPFCSYGGVLADDDEVRDLLLAAAADLARELRVRHLELRQNRALESGPGWRSVAAKVLMTVPLPEAAEILFGSLSSRLRNKIRAARKNGLRPEWGGGELLDAFYGVFAENMRDLGTPVYPRTFFANLLQHHPACKLLVLRDGEEAIATTLLLPFREKVELPWIASRSASRRKYSTVLLYWSALEWVIENGYRRADLGRCTHGSGTYQFKMQWNCEETPLPWHYWLPQGRTVPELRPDNPKYRVAIRLWKRLPLPVANALGPRIVRAIP
jgi:serine/alanine adding enzyme